MIGNLKTLPSKMSPTKSVFRQVAVAFFVLAILFVNVKDANANTNVLTQSASVKVSGTVIDATGSTVPGATVSVVGTTIGTLTNIDGQYELSVQGMDEFTLRYSFIGLETVEIPYAGNSKMDVTLQNQAVTTEDVVVVAYGTRKKGTIAGSVSTVDGEKLASVPAAGFDQALQGSTPGLSVMSSSGEPSEAATFRIRGTNSINSGTDPLFILDGIQISSSDFNTISPSDIESVSVLKDASSTSIYGARAANGVVVITTKRGKLGVPKITLRAQGGVSDLSSDNWNLMDTPERIQYEKELGLTDGQDYDRLSQTNVNWRDEVFQSSPLQSYELSASGASEKLNYFLSTNFFDQDGIAQGSTFNRYSLRSNFDIRASERLKLGTNTMFTYQEVEQAEDGQYALYAPISASSFMLPYWDPYNDDGSIASVNDGTWEGTGQNPIEWMDNNPLLNKKYKVISNLYAEFEIIKNLKFKTQFGIDYSNVTALSTSNASYAPNAGEGSAARSAATSLNLSTTNTLTYNFDRNNVHFFNFLLGQEGINYDSESFSVSTAGQINDELLTVSSGTRATGWYDSTTSYGYLSFFGRGEYNYNHKYYADFSLRTDGSSRFGDNNKWATFWSIGLMWNAKKEDFLKSSAIISGMEVAFSTGTSGNSSIPNYDHLGLVSGNVDYVDNGGLVPIQRGAEDLSWESLWSTNLGVRMQFINRINFDIEAYNKKTTDMLMSVPVSYSDGGYGFQWDNVGTMVNRGLELSIDVDVIRNKNFRWNLSANASYNKNKLVELYDGVDEYTLGTTGTKLQVGHSVGEFFYNRYAGVNPANGDALWYDIDGNVTEEFNESDKVFLDKTYIAPWQGGFGTTIAYKGLSLQAQFSWVADKYVFNNDRYFQESNGLYTSYNQSKKLLYDRWKNPGDVTDIPRHGVVAQFDSRFVEDASFLKLKNLTINYDFPTSLLNRSGFINKARIYAQGQNLLTFTKFTGFDPETASNIYAASYPMTRQFTLGLEIVF